MAALRAPHPVAAARVQTSPVLPLEPMPETSPAAPAGPRRTVTITGRGAEGHLWANPRRPTTHSYERAGFKPD
ncbi:MAG TPA: hypothetical protein VLP43_08705 [Solirubrobacteraceae bacterium]|nr:hypothetical protein [Solirubrobacteraceae bacterium]